MIVKMFKKYITTLKLPKNKALNDYIQECVEIAKAHTGTLFFLLCILCPSSVIKHSVHMSSANALFTREIC